MKTSRKIGIPDQSGLIKRPHLQQALADILSKRVTLLRAPAGCGKTSIAAQIASEVSASVVWLTITPYMQDARTFYRQFLDRLVQINPEIPVLQNSLQQPAELIAHEMAQLIGEFIPDPLLIVLDDWQIISSQRSITMWLNTFIDMLPPNCHILLTSREHPALKTVQLISSKQILALPQDELFFTEAELYMLATKLRPGNPVDPEALQAIWESMRGWPAGTVLALQPSSSSAVLELTQELPPSEMLFQEIARDSLHHQTPDVQRFLKWSSTLDVFTPDLLKMVFEFEDSDQPLADVQRQNLFLSQDSNGYRYHHLFRTFLQNHFRLNNPDEFGSAHRRAGAWYETQGSYDRAVDHYLQGGAVDRAVQQVEAQVYIYFVQGRIETLRQFRTQLAAAQVSTPHLDHVSAKIYLDFDQNPEQAMLSAERALAVFQQRGEISWVLELTIQRGEILLRQARYADAQAIFQQVYTHPEVRPIQRGNARMRMGTCALMQANTAQAVEYLEDALPLLEEHAGLYDRSLALQALEMAYRAAGRVDDANICLHHLVDLRRQLDNPEALASALNNLGYRYYEQGQIPAARDTYAQGLEVVQLLQASSSRYHLYSSFADLERDLGYYEQARDYYQRALTLVEKRDPAARCEMLLHLAQLYRWQNRQEAALTCADEALTIAREHNMEAVIAQARIIIHDIHLQPKSARSIDLDTRSLADGGAPVLLMVLRLRIAQMLQHETTYHTILTELQNWYCKGISIQPFFAEALNNAVIETLISSYPSRYSHLLNAVKHLRQYSSGHSENTIIPIDSPVHHLQCYMLGKMMIRRDGRLIPDREIATNAARELFAYLVLNKSVSVDLFGLFYWPDLSDDKVRSNFGWVVSRLRNAVGNQTILYDNTDLSYRINPQIHLWCDVLRIEQLTAEARKLSPDSLRAYDAWYQATQLYSGELLPELDRDWVIAKREQLHNLAIQAWHGLATYYSRHQNYPGAINAYESAIRIEPSYEEAYRGQMICWAMLGEKARIKKLYQELIDMLHSEYATQPSESTRQLYQRLIH